MAFPPLKSTGAVTGGTAVADQPQPAPGETSRLAGKLAAKASGAKERLAPIISAPGTKGGRKSIAEESAAYLASRGEVAVPAQAAGPQMGLGVQPPTYVVTPEFVEDATKTLCKAIEKADVTSVTRRVQTLCGDSKLAKEYGDSAAAPPGCIDTLAGGMKELAKKYPGLLQWAPELTVAGAASAWLMCRSELNARLTDLERRLIDSGQIQPKPAKVATPPPVPTGN